MKLRELEATNFMLFAGKMSLVFPIDADRNVMLVFGSNNCGKTSLLTALQWAFYGQAGAWHSGEIPLQDLVNEEAAAEGHWLMETRVNFEADGHAYELRRRVKKRASVATPTHPEDFEVSRALKKDGIALGDHLVDAEINRFAPEQKFPFLIRGETLEYLEAPFGPSIGALPDDLRTRVEELASKFFRKVRTQSYYSSLRFNGNYGLIVLDEHGDEVSGLSLGAKQTVLISLIVGLSQAGLSPGPLVMDEPFNWLDEERRTKMLRYLPPMTEQLILLIHENQVKESTAKELMGSRVGSVYEIAKVNPRHSRVERVS